MIKQASIVLALRVIGALLVFLVNIYIAKLIGAEQYGAANFLISVAMIVSLFAVFGSNRILTKYVARYAEDETLSFRYYFQSLRRTLLIFAAAAVVLCLLLIVDGRSWANISLTAGLAIAISLKNVNEGYLLARSRAVFVSLHEAVSRPVAIALFLYASATLMSPDANAYLMSMLLALGIIVVWQSIVIKPVMKAATQAPAMTAKEWWLESFPFFLLSSVVILQSQTGVFFLGLLDTDGETGLFAVAVRISTLLSFALMATNLVYMGPYSKAYHDNDIARLNRDVRFVSLFTAAFALIVFPLLMLTADFWLGLFGEEFVAARNMLAIQALALLVNTLFGPAALILSMTEFAKEASRVTLWATILNVLLTVVLVLGLSGVGAALANLVTMTAMNAVLATLVWKKLRVRSGIVGMLVFGRQS